MSSELKDFVSAFGMGMRLSDSWELAKDRRERRKRRDALDPNKSPEVQGVEDAYKQSGGTGSLGAVPVDQTGYTEGYGSDGTIMNYGEGYREGGIVRDTEQEAEADSAANQRDNPTRHGYMAEELGGTSGEMPQYRSRSKRRAMDVVPDIMQRDSTDFNRKFPICAAARWASRPIATNAVSPICRRAWTTTKTASRKDGARRANATCRGSSRLCRCRRASRRRSMARP
jgi:hypothetical protein